MTMETRTEAHSIVDNTPGGRGLEAWRRLAQRFDPALAQANRKLMSKSAKPPKGDRETQSFSLEKWEETARRQND